MIKRTAIGILAAIVLMAALPCTAQDLAKKGGGPCGIEGTWYGANSAGFNFVFRMEKNAAGHHSIVADGFGFPAPGVRYCFDYTAWHGELEKIAPKTFLFRQIELCNPNPDVFPGLPPSTLLLWASEGELTLVGCDQIEAYIPFNGAYVWGSGSVPFVDPPVIPFPGPITGTFHRMPRP